MLLAGSQLLDIQTQKRYRSCCLKLSFQLAILYVLFSLYDKFTLDIACSVMEHPTLVKAVLCYFMFTNYRDFCKSAFSKTDYPLCLLCFRGGFHAVQILQIHKLKSRDSSETFSTSSQARCTLALHSHKLCMCI